MCRQTNEDWSSMQMWTFLSEGFSTKRAPSLHLHNCAPASHLHTLNTSNRHNFTSFPSSLSVQGSYNITAIWCDCCLVCFWRPSHGQIDCTHSCRKSQVKTIQEVLKKWKKTEQKGKKKRAVQSGNNSRPVARSSFIGWSGICRQGPTRTLTFGSSRSFPGWRSSS